MVWCLTLCAHEGQAGRWSLVLWYRNVSVLRKIAAVVYGYLTQERALEQTAVNISSVEKNTSSGRKGKLAGLTLGVKEEPATIPSFWMSHVMCFLQPCNLHGSREHEELKKKKKTNLRKWKLGEWKHLCFNLVWGKQEGRQTDRNRDAPHWNTSWLNSKIPCYLPLFHGWAMALTPFHTRHKTEQHWWNGMTLTSSGS